MRSRPTSGWATAVASVGYIGFFPVAPGTVASAVAALAYWLFGPLQQVAVLAPAAVATFVVGGLATGAAVRGGGPKDPSHVVCDEVAGQWIALLTFAHAGRWEFIVLAFLLFRLFDVWKPQPVAFFDRRPGAWNVMMDDVAAAVYANAATHLCLFFAWG